MAFWNKKRETRADSGLAAPSDWMLDAFSTTTASSGQRVTVQKAMGVAPVWGAVSLISEQIGVLPLKVYRTLDDGERILATSHRAWRLLHDRPNPVTPAGRFWATAAVHLLLWGNAFLFKKRNDLGEVEELWLLEPDTVSVFWNRLTGDKTFRYQPGFSMGGGNTPDVTYTTDDVLHVFGMSLDGIVGQSVISSCKNAFGSALARDEYEGGFYNRGAIFAGVLQAQRPMSDNALKRLAASFKALYGGVNNAHAIPVLEEGVEFKPIGSPMKDLEFVASQQLSRTDIAVMFKLPPNYLGGSSGDSLVYSTVEMNQTHFATHAITPLTGTISDALTQDPSIMPQNVHDCEFTLEGMLRGVAQERAAFYKSLTEVKAITPDEIRRRENLPPLTASQKTELTPAPTLPVVQQPNSPVNGTPPSNGNSIAARSQ